MRKIIISLVSVSILLTACANNDTNKTAEKSKSVNQQSTPKAKHDIQKKEGITTVDGIILANKKAGLPQSYHPGENKTARQQLDRMMKDANKQGLDVVFRSGFRSYQEQEGLYNNYVKRDGKTAADQYSARPGHSEHQTGLAFDVGTSTGGTDFLDAFGKTPEGKWLAKHAHEYGFILRYPKGKEQMTGYQYEPWHFRYVGKKTAKAIYDKQLTLEEYLDYGYDKQSTK
ncbi:D-alanyl-D-alanine carboxypeptidase family protein [Staphylococcus simulans]|uniref:M15 family metallopeptidase n=1 Tax=Staphylococcus simulans TaxID=1286 RepID=UPI000D03A380|nr:M15 family metallopeptidase [Staphylococcus simulans]